MSSAAERRASKAAERQDDREDRRLELETKLKARELAAENKRRDDAAKAELAREEEEARVERARKDAAEKRRQELADKRVREQEKARKRAARTARLGKAGRWLNSNPVTVFVGFVMASSVIPAVISQVGALGEAGVYFLLAGLLAAMLEGGAWALTFMGKAAEDAGRPAGKYRAGTWVTAFIAAAVNYWHWAEKLPAHQWVAIVFAASSLFAIYLWDMKTHGSGGRTKEQRREAKARRRHLAARRRDHKDVAREADRLLSAMPYGALDEEEAFAAAWRIRHGAEPGLSAEVYARVTDSRVALGAAFELGEHVRPELVRAGMLAALHNPLPHRLAEGLQMAGPSRPAPALDEAAREATAQAGIGSNAREKASSTAHGKAGGRRTDAELEQLMPAAHEAAVELVAEGKQISAAALAKRLKIRREDGVWLRDRVLAERKLHLVAKGA